MGKAARQGPKLMTYGECTHLIKPIKYVRVMKWWCDTCNNYATKAYQKLIERAKGK